MTAKQLQIHLRENGVKLWLEDGMLAASHTEKLTPELLVGLKLLKPELISLLNPRRTYASDLPSHWQHIPDIPAKGERWKGNIQMVVVHAIRSTCFTGGISLDLKPNSMQLASLIAREKSGCLLT
ncbi:MAG: hypothetical protein KC422_20305 [Trueperaceae bacterium]|nr:hypothetical protein [Trueperaceae bacterium]